MKSIYELIDKSQDTWNILQQWKRESTNKVEFLPANKNNVEKVLYDLQVTAKSILGAIAYYTGGILVANGWIRILGSGADNFNRDISRWNKLKLDGALLVADDVIGGFFTINGGYFEGEVGNMFYLAPDTLEWENFELKFSDFVYWTFTGDISKFYEIFRWEQWEKDTSKVTGDMGILIYPFLWAEGEEIEKRSRKVVPMEELWGVTNGKRNEVFYK